MVVVVLNLLLSMKLTFVVDEAVVVIAVALESGPVVAVVVAVVMEVVAVFNLTLIVALLLLVLSDPILILGQFLSLI